MTHGDSVAAQESTFCPWIPVPSGCTNILECELQANCRQNTWWVTSQKHFDKSQCSGNDYRLRLPITQLFLACQPQRARPFWCPPKLQKDRNIKAKQSQGATWWNWSWNVGVVWSGCRFPSNFLPGWHGTVWDSKVYFLKSFISKCINFL